MAMDSGIAGMVIAPLYFIKPLCHVDFIIGMAVLSESLDPTLAVFSSFVKGIRDCFAISC